MKQTKFLRKKTVFLLSLGALLLSGVATYSSFLFKQDIETSASVGNYATNPATYYAGVENKTQNQLLWGLHDLMISTHHNYTNYDDMGSNNYQGYTDKDPNNSNNILAWYSRASIPKSWSGGTYDREHVWPQSLSNNLYGTSSGGSDMHHIRPTIKAINNRRGNKLFGNVGSSYDTITYGTGNLDSKYTSNIFEPHDQVKGDAARIIMYMYVHYNSSKALGNGNNVENRTTTLPITNVIQGANAKAAFDLLLDWHELDPVDGLEIARNNQVAIYQGNRNPFIDRPEFASHIWGDEISPTSLTISPSIHNIVVNEEKTLNLTPTPTNASTAADWLSSNANTVTVNNGVIKGISAGTATITATSKLNSSVKTTTTVNVSQISVTGVSIPNSLALEIDQTQTITPTISPSNATNKNVSWTSSNTNVATVHATSGLVTAKAVGTTIVTVKTQDGNFTDTTTVSVSALIIHPKTLTLNTTNFKKNYVFGEELDLSNLSAVYKDENNTSTTINSSSLILTSGSTKMLGPVSLVFSYQGVSDDVLINVTNVGAPTGGASEIVEYQVTGTSFTTTLTGSPTNYASITSGGITFSGDKLRIVNTTNFMIEAGGYFTNITPLDNLSSIKFDYLTGGSSSAYQTVRFSSSPFSSASGDVTEEVKTSNPGSSKTVNAPSGSKYFRFDISNKNIQANVTLTYTEGVSLSFTPLEQATAYYNYFMNITHEECLVSNVQASTWLMLENEYNAMSLEAQNELKALAINELNERYSLIIDRYQYNDFIYLTTNNEQFVLLNKDSKPIAFVVLAVLIALLSGSLYLVFKKKKTKFK